MEVMMRLSKPLRTTAAQAFCLVLLFGCWSAHADDAGTVFGAEDDLTVLGTNGTSTDADMEVKGFTVFGPSGSGATVVTQGVGNAFAAGSVEVASNLYVGGNVGIGTANPSNTLEVSGAVIMEDSGAPSPEGGHSGLYSSGGELYAVDAAGNATQISPHDSESGEWVFFSKNLKTGRVMKVDMERLVRAVEALTSESFMREWVEE